MRVDLHVYIHQDTDPKLDQILALLGQIKQGESQTMAEIDDLIAAVQAEKTVEDAETALLTTLTGQINTLVQNATDLATLKSQITAVTSDVNAHASEIQDAITANTPAAPGP